MQLTDCVSLASFKTTSLDVTGNTEIMLQQCQQAAAQGKTCIVFPELCVTGHDCGEMFANRYFIAAAAEAVQKLVGALPENLTAGFGCALEGSDHRIYNTWVLATRGSVQAVTVLPPEGSNARYFAAPAADLSFVFADGSAVSAVAAGEVMHAEVQEGTGTDYVPVCVIYPTTQQAVNGTHPADAAQLDGGLLVLPQVLPYEEGTQCERENITLSASIAFPQTVVAAVNSKGNEGGSYIYDGICVLAAEGKLIASSQACSFSKSSLTDSRTPVCSAPFRFDEMLKAVALGVYDYMHRTRSKGFVVSMSGGADSALCSTVSTLAQLYALTEMGAEAYVADLAQCGVQVKPFAGSLTDGKAVLSYIKEEVMPHLLTTVYQGSDNSSDITRTAAREVAHALGSSHFEWSISRAVAVYTELCNSLTPGKPMTWEHDDLTLQNIQARARLPGIWMVANREGKLLLATSNLSEAVVGYCTMDGDTAGGLSPIAGIGKSVVRQINKHLETTGVHITDDIVFTIPEMSYVNAQAPTAELRPGGKQTDEGDLMPYVILDFIRRAFAVDRLSPVLILRQLQQNFAGFDKETLKGFVKRYFKLHVASQWKREREATGFHIEKDDASPKGYWSFPMFANMGALLQELDRE